VHWQPSGAGDGFWSLTKHADLVAAYRDPAFSSRGGPMLGGSFRSHGDTAAGRMLVAADPPQHRMLRQVIHRAFSPSVLDEASRHIAVAVDRALTRALADGGCDFATDVAPVLPAAALAALLGLAPDDAYHLMALTHEMIGVADPAVTRVGAGSPAAEGDADWNDDRLRLAGIQAEIFEFFADLIAERRRDPGPGLLGVLLSAQINGRPLTEDEVIYNCLNVSVGGNETTASSACAGLAALMDNPAPYDLLLSGTAGPGLIDSAVQEILRWSSTNAYTQRVACRDVELRGRKIEAGQPVALWNVSANYDEDKFPHADRFDIARTPNPHLAFGSGIHRCVGAQLSVCELAHLFTGLAKRRIRFEPDGEMTRLRSNFMLGITNLPVRVAGAAGYP
jgi:cytochrome P450